MKMDQENITFSKNQDKSYIMTDLHVLGYNMSFGYEDCYDYQDINVDKILLLKKGDREYFVRYNDVNKKGIVSLQIFFRGILEMLPQKQILEAMIESFL